MRKRAALTVALLAALALLPQPSDAYHRWFRWHWPRSSNPVTIRYTTQVSGPWGALVGPVLNDWDNVHKRRPGTRDIVRFATGGSQLVIQSGNYGDNGWLGIAEILEGNFVGGHIRKARVRVNDYYFTGPYGNDTARRSVLCQEVGHTLGLEHNELPLLFGFSCMNDLASPNDPNYRSPNYHDAATLNGIYAHRDGAAARAADARGIVLHMIPA